MTPFVKNTSQILSEPMGANQPNTLFTGEKRTMQTSRENVEFYTRQLMTDVETMESAVISRQDEEMLQYCKLYIVNSLCMLASHLSDYPYLERGCILTAYNIRPSEDLAAMLQEYNDPPQPYVSSSTDLQVLSREDCKSENEDAPQSGLLGCLPSASSNSSDDNDISIVHEDLYRGSFATNSQDTEKVTSPHTTTYNQTRNAFSVTVSGDSCEVPQYLSTLVKTLDLIQSRILDWGSACFKESSLSVNIDKATDGNYFDDEKQFTSATEDLTSVGLHTRSREDDQAATPNTMSSTNTQNILDSFPVTANTLLAAKKQLNSLVSGRGLANLQKISLFDTDKRICSISEGHHMSSDSSLSDKPVTNASPNIFLNVNEQSASVKNNQAAIKSIELVSKEHEISKPHIASSEKQFFVSMSISDGNKILLTVKRNRNIGRDRPNEKVQHKLSGRSNSFSTDRVPCDKRSFIATSMPDAIIKAFPSMHQPHSVPNFTLKTEKDLPSVSDYSETTKDNSIVKDQLMSEPEIKTLNEQHHDVSFASTRTVTSCTYTNVKEHLVDHSVAAVSVTNLKKNFNMRIGDQAQTAPFAPIKQSNDVGDFIKPKTLSTLKDCKKYDQTVGLPEDLHSLCKGTSVRDLHGSDQVAKYGYSYSVDQPNKVINLPTIPCPNDIRQSSSREDSVEIISMKREIIVNTEERLCNKHLSDLGGQNRTCVGESDVCISSTGNNVTRVVQPLPSFLVNHAPLLSAMLENTPCAKVGHVEQVGKVQLPNPAAHGPASFSERNNNLVSARHSSNDFVSDRSTLYGHRTDEINVTAGTRNNLILGTLLQCPKLLPIPPEMKNRKPQFHNQSALGSGPQGRPTLSVSPSDGVTMGIKKPNPTSSVESNSVSKLSHHLFNRNIDNRKRMAYSHDNSIERRALQPQFTQIFQNNIKRSACKSMPSAEIDISLSPLSMPCSQSIGSINPKTSCNLTNAMLQTTSVSLSSEKQVLNQHSHTSPMQDGFQTAESTEGTAKELGCEEWLTSFVLASLLQHTPHHDGSKDKETMQAVTLSDSSKSSPTKVASVSQVIPNAGRVDACTSSPKIDRSLPLICNPTPITSLQTLHNPRNVLPQVSVSSGQEGPLYTSVVPNYLRTTTLNARKDKLLGCELWLNSTVLEAWIQEILRAEEISDSQIRKPNSLLEGQKEHPNPSTHPSVSQVIQKTAEKSSISFNLSPTNTFNPSYLAPQTICVPVSRGELHSETLCSTIAKKNMQCTTSSARKYKVGCEQCLNCTLLATLLQDTQSAGARNQIMQTASLSKSQKELPNPAIQPSVSEVIQNTVGNLNRKSALLYSAEVDAGMPSVHMNRSLSNQTLGLKSPQTTCNATNLLERANISVSSGEEVLDRSLYTSRVQKDSSATVSNVATDKGLGDKHRSNYSLLSTCADARDQIMQASSLCEGQKKFSNPIIQPSFDEVSQKPTDKFPKNSAFESGTQSLRCTAELNVCTSVGLSRSPSLSCSTSIGVNNPETIPTSTNNVLVSREERIFNQSVCTPPVSDYFETTASIMGTDGRRQQFCSATLPVPLFQNTPCAKASSDHQILQTGSLPKRQRADLNSTTQLPVNQVNQDTTEDFYRQPASDSLNQIVNANFTLSPTDRLSSKRSSSHETCVIPKHKINLTMLRVIPPKPDKKLKIISFVCGSKRKTTPSSLQEILQRKRRLTTVVCDNCKATTVKRMKLNERIYAVDCICGNSSSFTYSDDYSLGITNPSTSHSLTGGAITSSAKSVCEFSQVGDNTSERQTGTKNILPELSTNGVNQQITQNTNKLPGDRVDKVCVDLMLQAVGPVPLTYEPDAKIKLLKLDGKMDTHTTKRYHPNPGIECQTDCIPTVKSNNVDLVTRDESHIHHIPCDQIAQFSTGTSSCEQRAQNQVQLLLIPVSVPATTPSSFTDDESTTSRKRRLHTVSNDGLQKGTTALLPCSGRNICSEQSWAHGDQNAADEYLTSKISEKLCANEPSEGPLKKVKLENTLSAELETVPPTHLDVIDLVTCSELKACNEKPLSSGHQIAHYNKNTVSNKQPFTCTLDGASKTEIVSHLNDISVCTSPKEVGDNVSFPHKQHLTNVNTQNIDNQCMVPILCKSEGTGRFTACTEQPIAQIVQQSTGLSIKQEIHSQPPCKSGLPCAVDISGESDTRIREQLLKVSTRNSVNMPNKDPEYGLLHCESDHREQLLVSVDHIVPCAKVALSSEQQVCSEQSLPSVDRITSCTKVALSNVSQAHSTQLLPSVNQFSPTNEKKTCDDKSLALVDQIAPCGEAPLCSIQQSCIVQSLATIDHTMPCSEVCLNNVQKIGSQQPRLSVAHLTRYTEASPSSEPQAHIEQTFAPVGKIRSCTEVSVKNEEEVSSEQTLQSVDRIPPSAKVSEVIDPQACTEQTHASVTQNTSCTEVSVRNKQPACIEQSLESVDQIMPCTDVSSNESQTSVTSFGQIASCTEASLCSEDQLHSEQVLQSFEETMPFTEASASSEQKICSEHSADNITTFSDSSSNKPQPHIEQLLEPGTKVSVSHEHQSCVEKSLESVDQIPCTEASLSIESQTHLEQTHASISHIVPCIKAFISSELQVHSEPTLVAANQIITYYKDSESTEPQTHVKQSAGTIGQFMPFTNTSVDNKQQIHSKWLLVSDAQITPFTEASPSNEIQANREQTLASNVQITPCTEASPSNESQANLEQTLASDVQITPCTEASPNNEPQANLEQILASNVQITPCTEACPNNEPQANLEQTLASDAQSKPCTEASPSNEPQASREQTLASDVQITPCIETSPNNEPQANFEQILASDGQITPCSEASPSNKPQANLEQTLASDVQITPCIEASPNNEPQANLEQILASDGQITPCTEASPSNEPQANREQTLVSDAQITPFTEASPSNEIQANREQTLASDAQSKPCTEASPSNEPQANLEQTLASDAQSKPCTEASPSNEPQANLEQTLASDAQSKPCTEASPSNEPQANLEQTLASDAQSKPCTEASPSNEPQANLEQTLASDAQSKPCTEASPSNELQANREQTLASDVQVTPCTEASPNNEPQANFEQILASDGQITPCTEASPSNEPQANREQTLASDVQVTPCTEASPNNEPQANFEQILASDGQITPCTEASPSNEPQANREQTLASDVQITPCTEASPSNEPQANREQTLALDVQITPCTEASPSNEPQANHEQTLASDVQITPCTEASPSNEPQANIEQTFASDGQITPCTEASPSNEPQSNLEQTLASDSQITPCTEASPSNELSESTSSSNNISLRYEELQLQNGDLSLSLRNCYEIGGTAGINMLLTSEKQTLPVASLPQITEVVPNNGLKVLSVPLTALNYTSTQSSSASNVVLAVTPTQNSTVVANNLASFIAAPLEVVTPAVLKAVNVNKSTIPSVLCFTANNKPQVTNFVQNSTKDGQMLCTQLPLDKGQVCVPPRTDPSTNEVNVSAVGERATTSIPTDAQPCTKHARPEQGKLIFPCRTMVTGEISSSPLVINSPTVANEFVAPLSQHNSLNSEAPYVKIVQQPTAYSVAQVEALATSNVNSQLPIVAQVEALAPPNVNSQLPIVAQVEALAPPNVNSQLPIVAQVGALAPPNVNSQLPYTKSSLWFVPQVLTTASPQSTQTYDQMVCTQTDITQTLYSTETSIPYVADYSSQSFVQNFTPLLDIVQIIPPTPNIVNNQTIQFTPLTGNNSVIPPRSCIVVNDPTSSIQTNPWFAVSSLPQAAAQHHLTSAPMLYNWTPITGNF